MANLITPEQLHVLNQVRLARIFIVGSVLLSIAALVGIVALMPSYLIARYERGAYESQIATVRAAIDLRREQVGTLSLRDARDQMNMAQVIAARGSEFSDTLAVVLQKPDAVHVVSITYVHQVQDGEKQGVFVIGGVADSREALAAYVDSLRKNGTFKTVEVPIATIARTGGEFSITVTGDF